MLKAWAPTDVDHEGHERCDLQALRAGVLRRLLDVPEEVAILRDVQEAVRVNRNIDGCADVSTARSDMRPSRGPE